MRNALAQEAQLEQLRHHTSSLDDLGIVGTALFDLENQLAVAETSRRANNTMIEPLTTRELTVLDLLRSQLTQREIANELYVSFDTARTHTTAIYRKLGVHSRAAAVAVALGNGLIGTVPPESG